LIKVVPALRNLMLKYLRDQTIVDAFISFLGIYVLVVAINSGIMHMSGYVGNVFGPLFSALAEGLNVVAWGIYIGVLLLIAFSLARR